MCKKCKTYLAAPDSDYCFNCAPSPISTSQTQTSTDFQKQSQNVQDSGIKVNMEQEQKSGGSQSQSYTKMTPSQAAESGKLGEINNKLDDISENLELIKTYTS